MSKTELTDIVSKHTKIASGVGAVPVPASSFAIVGDNVALITEIALASKQNVTIDKVVGSIGTMTALNCVGRTVFVEAAKALSWGTGSFWAAAGLSAMGAATAGFQTYLVGMLAVEIANNGGEVLSTEEARAVAGDARATYEDMFNQD